jgi:hypothetical protein
MITYDIFNTYLNTLRLIKSARKSNIQDATYHLSRTFPSFIPPFTYIDDPSRSVGWRIVDPRFAGLPIRLREKILEATDIELFNGFGY